MIRSTLKQLFDFGVKEVKERLAGSPTPQRQVVPPTRRSSLPTTEEPSADPSPIRRPPPVGGVPGFPPATSAPNTDVRVVYPRVLTPPLPEAGPPEAGIRILAQPSADNRQCTFTLDRPVLDGLSWRFQDKAAALGSPLGERLFAHEQVAWAQVDHDAILVARRAGKEGDWLPLAREIGATLRKAVREDVPLLTPETLGALPSSEVIRAGIEGLIVTEVNPGLASHGGNVRLREVRGNAVYLEMGGGCQGCSAAALTLKVGIYNAFRAAIPGVGAIYDLTDHAAGVSPFYQDPVS